MADVTITGLPDASTPLTGAERVPMDQAGVTVDSSTQEIADLAGTAITAAVNDHVAEADPHPVYLTSTEGDAAYDATGSAAAVQSYVDTNYSKAFDFQQVAPSSTWTVNHNLGFKPAVDLYSAGSQEIDGDIVHTSDNQTVVTFTVPIAGFARLN